MDKQRGATGLVYTMPTCQSPAEHRPADYDEYPGMYSDTLCGGCTMRFILDSFRLTGLSLAQ